jgi:hypothetical protein
MEQTECSETSAFKTQTPGNYPKEIIQHSKHGESLNSRSVKHVSKAILFADDTSVIVNDKDHDSFKQKTNLALTTLNKWLYINQLPLNITKTNFIKCTPKTTLHVPLDIHYKDNVNG